MEDQNQEKEFELEERYFVVKMSDAEQALTQRQMNELNRMGDKVEKYRKKRGADPLWGVFVEHDWPEYNTVVTLIQRRVEEGKPVPVTIGEIPDKQELINKVHNFREALRLLEPIAGGAENFEKVMQNSGQMSVAERLSIVRQLLSSGADEEQESEDEKKEAQGELVDPSEGDPGNP